VPDDETLCEDDVDDNEVLYVGHTAGTVAEILYTLVLCFVVRDVSVEVIWPLMALAYSSQISFCSRTECCCRVPCRFAFSNIIALIYVAFTGPQAEKQL
jgi:hypothetical protein